MRVCIIQLKYSYGRYWQFPLPPTLVYFYRLSRGMIRPTSSKYINYVFKILRYFNEYGYLCW